MTLTSSGNLGINSTTPSSRLSIGGDAYISGVTTITGNLNAGTVISNSIDTGNSTFRDKVGISTNSPLYDLQVGRNPTVSNGVGISSAGNVVVSGIITSTGGFTSGLGTAVQIFVTESTLTFTVPGVGTTSLTLL